MSYFLHYREDGYYDGEHYCGWGDFKCSVCKRDVFIQYDAHEKPSTGELIEWKGKCYCLCNKCISKCMNVGKAKLLKDAKDYKPTDDTENQEPEYLKDVPTEYKSLAGFIPAIALIAAIGIELKRIQKLPEDQRKKTKEQLKERLKKIKEDEEE